MTSRTAPSLRARTPLRRAMSSLGLWGVALWLAGCGGSSSQTTSTTDSTQEGRTSPQTAPPPQGDPSPQTAPPPRSGATPAPTSPATPANPANPYAAQYANTRASQTLSGRASYYSDRLAGRSTASGDPYRPAEYTAASRDLRFGTILRVTREDTGAVTYVRVNDRGPFGDRQRIVDLSRAAAEDLSMIRAGVVSVRVEIVHQPAR